MKALGLDYIKIDACRNDCMLYWEDKEDATSCHICKASRWKSEKKDEITGKVRRISAKIHRYFPIKKRLQRLFMSPETARHMAWHADQRPRDGLLRHVADSEDWKNFDLLYPNSAYNRNLLNQNHPDGKSPSKAVLYIDSRKRVPGRPYKTDHMTPLQNIEEMKEIQSLPDRVGNEDPYYEVIKKKEHSGRLRLFGRTVTKTSLKENESKGHFVLPQMYMDNIEEYLEKKILSKVISQLQELNPGINLNIPNLTTRDDGQTHDLSENDVDPSD